MSEKINRVGHQDLRIGTIAQMGAGADYIRQILPHGFESFQMFAWQYLPEVDLPETARQVNDVIAGKATVSSIGMFGNPLQDERTAADWEKCIRYAKAFGCDIVAGFAGALEDRPVDQSMAKFKEVFGRLAAIAEGEGVRIAFENCDMGGTWERPSWNIAHAPRAWEMMFNEVTSPNIGLEWEPCHQMNSLIDPLPQLRQWLPKIFHLHGKDATIDYDVIKTQGLRGGTQAIYHRHPGFGDTNWTDVITILRRGGFVGAIDIEGWHDPVYRDELEMTGQVFALNYLKRCRGGDYIANPTT